MTKTPKNPGSSHLAAYLMRYGPQSIAHLQRVFSWPGAYFDSAAAEARELGWIGPLSRRQPGALRACNRFRRHMNSPESSPLRSLYGIELPIYLEPERESGFRQGRPQRIVNGPWAPKQATPRDPAFRAQSFRAAEQLFTEGFRLLQELAPYVEAQMAASMDDPRYRSPATLCRQVEACERILESVKRAMRRQSEPVDAREAEQAAGEQIRQEALERSAALLRKRGLPA